MIEHGTEFLPTYIQMLIKYSGEYWFESLRYREKQHWIMFKYGKGIYYEIYYIWKRIRMYEMVKDLL